MFDSSKPNVKRTRRVTITDSDEEPADDDNYTSSSQLILPFDKVTYDEVINVEDTPQNNQSSHAEEHRSGQQVPSEHLLWVNIIIAILFVRLYDGLNIE